MFASLLAPGPGVNADPPCVNWSSPAPISARAAHAMAYDSSRSVTVLFGGLGGVLNSPLSTYFDDTWEWNGTTWIQRSSATSPSARSLHAMAYDSARRVTVLFGGFNDFTGDFSLGDTWEWDGTVWTQRIPATSPPGRYGQAMAYDSARGVIVLFGGSGTDNLLSDTWEWDGTNWTQRSPATSPSARYRPMMAYDSARGVTVLFGGSGSDFLSDTWEWDGTNWTQRSPATSPSARRSHAMAYDSARGMTVLVGGWNGSSAFSDTWEWDGTNWLQRTTATSPKVRYSPAMAYDSARGVTVLFGGVFPNVFLADTWEWNGANWTPLSPSLGNLKMAYDSARGKAVLFGTIASGSETWEWDGTAWTQRFPVTNPPARYGHAMAYDSARGVTVLFGGVGLSDTWEWNGTTWTQRFPATSPPPKHYHAMAYDSARGVTVMFGGWNGGNETWEWDGTTWTQRTPAAMPPARWSPALAYDSDRGVTVLFGGHNGPTLNDTWEWDGTNWMQRFPATIPRSRYQHALAYDSARGVTVLFGGDRPSGGSQLLGDTWEWNGTNWMQRTPATSPSARSSHTMAYDSGRGATVLFGGTGGSSGIIGDTWELRPIGPAPTITQNPASPLVCENSAVSLRATATGDGALSYQWRKNGGDLVDDVDTFGTQADTLVFVHAHPGDAGTYNCLVMLNDCTRAITNAATLTVYPAGSADGNGDSFADGRDIQAFINSLVDHGPVSASLCAYDLTADGVVDLADVEPFVSRLLN